MDPKIPSYNDLQKQYQDTFVATVPEGDADDADGFFHGVTHALAQIDLGQLEAIGRLARNANRGTADRPNLIRIAEPEVGAPLPATSAEFNARLTGDAGESFPSDIELLQEETGILAKTTAGGMFDETGKATIAAASDPGVAGRFSADTVLKVVNPPPHVGPVATVVADAIGGTDVEDTEVYRGRDLDFVRRRPAGGKAGDLAMEVEKIAGVVKAVDFPELDGYGTHGVAVCGVNNSPVPSDVLAAADAAVKASTFRIAAIKRYFALNSTSRPTDVTLIVQPRPKWAMSDIGADKTVQAGSLVDTIFLDSVEGLAVDKWIAIGAESRAIAQVGSNYVSLRSKLSAAPAAGTPVWSGGPLYETLYSRVLEMIYALGPGDALAPGMEGDRFRLVELSDFAIATPATTVRPIVNADIVEIITPGLIRIVQG